MSSRPGLTLLEVIVTATLLSLGVLTVAAPVARLQRSATASRLTLLSTASVAAVTEAARGAPCVPAAGSRREPPVDLRWNRTVSPRRALTAVEGETVAGTRRVESVRACR